MSQKIIDSINSFTTFKYDQHTKSVRNMQKASEANVDEFLSIMYILDSNLIQYKTTTNFDIRIIK